MSEPSWMKFVKWPPCSQCDARGFFVDPATQWPTECKGCKNGREAAIKDAQSFRRREIKAGRSA